MQKDLLYVNIFRKIVELLVNDENLRDPDYADDRMGFFESVEQGQRAADVFAMVVPLLRMCFPSSKCKMLLQDWTAVVAEMMPIWKEPTILGCFIYLHSCLIGDGRTVAEATTRMFRAWAAYTGLKHSWRRFDISLKLEDRVHFAWVNSVLLCSCEA